ncbi:hypothetical protein FGK60_10475 [Streptomyces sp. DASNCL29]|nr:hypothetical protein FGK60_10475 [Streptomyces sp. DASNCL29]
MEKALLKVPIGWQASEHHQPAVVVREVNAVVAVRQNQRSCRLRGEDREVILDLLCGEGAVALREVVLAELVGHSGLGRQYDCASCLLDDSANERCDCLRIRGQVFGHLWEDEEPASGAFLVPPRRHGNAVDLGSPECALELSAGPQCGAHVDALLRTVECGVLERRGNKWTDEDLAVRHVRHAVGHVSLEELPGVHRVVADLAVGNSFPDDRFHMVGVGSDGRGRSQVDPREVLAPGILGPKVRKQERVQGGAQGGKYILVCALVGASADPQAPGFGNVALGRMGIVEDQDVGGVDPGPRVEDVTVSTDGYRAPGLKAREVGLVPILRLADEKRRRDTVVV